MKLLYRRCAGMDVHKCSVSVCVRRRARGGHVEVEEAVFGTFTQQLEQLRDWLRQRKVRHVAMESTGVYWIPVWNVFESGKHKFELTLVNATAVRALQGQKTDRIDARRIAEFLQYGLLRASFIPPKAIRHLRELVRMRVHVQQDRNRVINRIARLLETVNLKLSSVASNIVGKSGRAILHRLAEGPQTAEKLAELALGKLKDKTGDLILALDGRPDEHTRWVLSGLLHKLDWLDVELARIDARLSEQTMPCTDVIRRLCTIPGVEVTTARLIVAELGLDMTVFGDAAHAASFAGLCPGNAESAGKRFSGRTRKGSRYLRRGLVQSGWSAARKRNCFLAALFRRLAHKHGMKKAVVAVAHRILVIAFSIIRDGTEYHERGGDDFDRRDPVRTATRLTRRLEGLGFSVSLQRRPIDPVPLRKAVPPEVCGKCHAWRLAKCIHDEPRPKRTYTKRQHTDSTTS